MLLLLLESVSFAEEAASGFTMSEIWQHSGWIARSVIVTLVLMMLLCIMVGIERAIAFSRARKHSIRLRNEIIGALQQGDVGGALRIAQDEQFKAGYLTGLLKAGLGELEERGADTFGLENAKRAVEKAHSEELAKLQKGMTILATTGSTAPFVGLFGTTFGVINAFQGMATAGSGLASISAGISEALITTGVGIGVAVFGVWLFNYFNFRIQKVGDELNSSEADFVQWATKLSQGSMRGAAKSMGAKLGGGADGPMADINVTPLIDVVLVLLVVFMVITPLLSSGLPVDLPVATTTVTVNDAGQHIVISVTAEKIAVEQEVMDLTEEGVEFDPEQLVRWVQAEFNRNPERSILIKADKTLEYGEVRKVMDVLAEYRFTSVFIGAGKEG